MDSSIFNEFIHLLKSKNNLIRLNLTDNSCIGDEQAIILSQILKTNTVLQMLVLNNTIIGDIGFQTLLSSLPNSLFQLIIDDSRISAKSLPCLLDFVKTYPNLKYVSLKNNGINESNVTNINVPDIIEKILQITNENHCLFDLNINNIVKEKMIGLRGGVYVILPNEQLRDDHLFELCNELKKMSNRNWRLCLGCNNKISYVGYGYLADILSSTITIDQLSVGNHMNEEACTTLLQDLWKNKTLRQFDINCSKLNIQHIEYLGRFIQNSPMLKEISLSGCEIDDDGAICLAKFLAASNLEKLDLSHNSISDRGCTTLLSSIPLTLTELLLDYNQIAESSLKTILAFRIHNRTLKNLKLTDNAIWEKLDQASKRKCICVLV